MADVRAAAAIADESDQAAPSLLEPTTPVVGAGHAGHGEIESRYLARRESARARCAWAEVGDECSAAPAADLPDADLLRRAVARAASIGTNLLTAIRPERGRLEAFSPTRAWTIGTAISQVPDPLTTAEALRDGGVVLNNAERWDEQTAELADSVALAFDANVRVACVLGRVTIPLLGEGYWDHPAVVAIEGTVLVSTGVDATPLELAAGTGRRVVGAQEVDATGGVALVVGIRQPLLADLWGLVADNVAFWPRVRLDLPVDPAHRAEVYGLEGPVDVIRVVRDVLDEQFLNPIVAERALAWWRANLLPSPRPTILTRSNNERARIRGLLPGGIGFVAAPTGVDAPPRAAAGSWTFRVSDGSADLLAALVAGDTIARHDLVERDARLANVFVNLGLATVDRG